MFCLDRYRQQPNASRSFRQAGGSRHAETRRIGTRSVQKKGGERSRNTNDQAMRGNLSLTLLAVFRIVMDKFHLRTHTLINLIYSHGRINAISLVP